MKHKINIKGAIVSNDDKWIYDMFEMESTSPKDVTEEIEKANGSDLEVIINSGGGDVHVASEIYTELRDYPARVESKIVGLAASAASVIAMAADNTKISPTGELMIHNSATIAWGDYRSMDKASEMLKNTNKTIANAYRLKSGMSEAALLDLMNKETWLTPQSALDKGLVDEIMFEDPNIKLSASAAVTNMIPQEVINGLRNGLLDKNKNDKELGIDKKTLDNALTDLKTDILNEIKQNTEPPKPEPAKNNLSKLFLNLK